MPELKPFTSYICPVGHGRLGHSGVYTGAYGERHRRPSDGVCICGTEMVEEGKTADGNVYILEFETINAHQAAALEAARGRGVWRQLSDEEWSALEWLPPVRREEALPLAIKSQYDTLLAWAESHEQPIRNVRLMATAAA